MKNFLLSFLLCVFSFAVSSAQEWSATLSKINGLPGEANIHSGSVYYKYTSSVFTPGTTVSKVRLTVTATNTNEAPNGNNVIFALSGLSVYDGNGTKVGYTAKSNADHNSLSYNTDGDGLPALSDDNVDTYFHSMWQQPAVADYHYIELTLDRDVASFSLEWTTRLGEEKNDPVMVIVSLGEISGNTSQGFALGKAVTTERELAVDNGFFVLRGNATSEFVTNDGYYYTGSGPLYMRCAEQGDKDPGVEHIMQLVPVADGRYLVYWPYSAKFLSNSIYEYNGLNGWQYSTDEFINAAEVSIVSKGNGYFELAYDCAYMGSQVTMYVGAEMRDGVNSKMKFFDLAHKNYLENQDYTQGYSLPIAFNWSIYNAELSDEAMVPSKVTLWQLASSYLQPYINDAETYLAKYGDHEGYCTKGEDDTLSEAIMTVKAAVSTVESLEEVGSAEQTIAYALSSYMAAGLGKYEALVQELLSTSIFTTYPYTPGTYPQTSKSILEGALSSIYSAKTMVGIYSATEYEAIYSQINSEVELFQSTKIAASAGGSDEVAGDAERVYVYLNDGSIDAYALASLDGDYYVEGGRLFFPIKDGETVYYSADEYDSCSTVAPELPYMTSFKFNNKYNHNLNVDAVAEPVTENIYFSLNAIGKWLTASFQLSDDRAVAYVDTVLQVSKETRQDFAGTVKYRVTYPGYNIVERIKVQDEIWQVTEPVGGVTEIPLTAAMLSTNKPSQQYNEGLANLLDNNPRTIFHSTWGSANDATVNVDTYIDIALPYSVEDIKIYYQTRPSTGYNPLVWEIYSSNDGDMWDYVRTLHYVNDNMPVNQANAEYTSPVINLGGEYQYIRILQTSGEYSKNHLVLSELRIYEVEEQVSAGGDSIKIQDALYENRYVPFGREYKVKVDWLTDNAASVPRIDIDIDGGAMVSSKSYYLNAKFRITGYGIYENFEDSVQIKGRGNSSWSSNPYDKNPYRLKFADKVKPFGLTKGKSWVLLANKQRGSLMANAMAMKVAQMAGTEYPNHIIPVELYINGQYRGNYMFTEKVGMANNSVDIDEELGYLLELDTYSSSDEPIYRTGVYALPVKISEPDLADLPTETAQLRKERIINDVREMSSVVNSGGDIETVLDIDALARFYLTNDLVLSQEINHPKSTFLYKDESIVDGKLTFGPVWDFDWGFGYEGSGSYYNSGTTTNLINRNMSAYKFWEDISKSETFKKHYYKVWVEFLQNNSMEELSDYIDSYYEFAESSFQNNSYYWGDNFSQSDVARAKQWLQARKEFIVGNLTEYNIDELLHPLAGDVNCNDVVTVHDAALICAYLCGDYYAAFNAVKADYDKSGDIDTDDASAVASVVLESELPSAIYRYNTPVALGTLYGNSAVMELGEEYNISLNLSSYNEEGYSAMQFDVKVPDGMFIYDITGGDALDGHNIVYSQMDMNTYRVVLYSEDNALLASGDAVVANITASAMSVIEEAAREISINNVYVVNDNNDEMTLADCTIPFGQATGIGTVAATMAISGGDEVTITALEPQDVAIYTVDGRLVRRQRVDAGTTTVSLPAGIYMVNGQKVVVY